MTRVHAPSPTPVVTVTPNPAIDHTAWIPGFLPGAVNRVVREHLVAGGKGVNVAAFLAAWGVPTLATGFLGATNGGTFDAFLSARGIAHRFVPVAGLNRTGVKIVDEEAGATTDVNFPGFEVGPDDVAALVEVVAAASAPARWVVLAGSLPVGAPPDLHRVLAEAVRSRGGLVAVDTSGPALRAALDGPADLAKPNREELEELTGQRLHGRDELLGAARQLAARGVRTVVVSLGAEGALFVRDGAAVFAAPHPVRVASTVGAGDAMVAGTVAGTLLDLPLTDVAALATAFSAIAVGQVGTQLDPDAARSLASDIPVEVLR